MAAQSWPELIDNAAAKLPVEDLRWAFWGLLAVTVAAGLMYVRRILAVPRMPTAGEIVEEFIARGKMPAAPPMKELEEAVHRGVNGQAERLKRVEADVGEIRTDLGRMGTRQLDSRLRLERVEAQLSDVLDLLQNRRSRARSTDG